MNGIEGMTDESNDGGSEGQSTELFVRETDDAIAKLEELRVLTSSPIPSRPIPQGKEEENELQAVKTRSRAD